MKRRWLRRLFLLLTIGFLGYTLFGKESSWSAVGFFVCGAVWYVLTWLRTRELDAPRPR